MSPPTLPRRLLGALCVAAAVSAHALPPTPERVQELCADVEGPAHCGRLIEAEQLKALPDLAVRRGDTLRVTLYPSGAREFTDTLETSSERTYALWDYWNPINAIVLFTTAGENIGYAVLQRANGQLTTLPAEPVLSPDRQRVAVADFCARQCANEVTLWRVNRDGLRKEAAFKPAAAWTDVTVTWKDGDVLAIQYTAAGADEPSTLQRNVADKDWRRF